MRCSRAGPLPAGLQDRLLFVGHLLLNPWVLSAFAGAFLASLSWMLALSTLTAEQRVISFLLDFAARLQASGFSARHLMLRMTRAELGNFLALQLETVTRALSHLRALGLID